MLSTHSSLILHCLLLLLLHKCFISIHTCCSYFPLSISQLKLLVLPLLQLLLLINLLQNCIPIPMKVTWQGTYFHSTLHEVPGITAVRSNTAAYNVTSSNKSIFSVEGGHCYTVLDHSISVSIFSTGKQCNPSEPVPKCRRSQDSGSSSNG